MGGIFAAIGGAGFDARRLTRAQWTATVVFWSCYVLLAAGVALDSTGQRAALPAPLRLALSPVLVAALWGAMVRWGPQARRWLAGQSVPGVVIFGLSGLLVATLALGSTIGFGTVAPFAADLPTGTSTLGVIGPAVGLLAATWLVLLRWQLQPPHVFWVLGLLGALGAGGLLSALVGGDVVGAVLLAVYLVPVYGSGPAIALGLVTPEKRPVGARPPTWAAFAVLAVALWGCFAIASYLWLGILGAA